MRFGPFPQRDLPVIEQVLKNVGIAYEVAQDDSLVQEYLEEAKNRPPTSHPYPAMDPAVHYVEFDETLIEKIGDQLEPYGITAQSIFEPDFQSTDYYCPSCSEHSLAPGRCPKHNVPLVSDEEYKRLKIERSQKDMQSAWKLLLISAAAGAAYYLYKLFSS